MTGARFPAFVFGSLFVFFVSVAKGQDAKAPRTDLYGDPLPPGAVARLGTIRLRHAGADVVFSADGKRMISCDRKGEIRVWDVATGEQVRRKQLSWLPADPSFLDKLLLSSNGRIVARAGKTVCWYDTATGKERGRLPGDQYAYSPLLAFCLDGKILAVERFENKHWVSIDLWELAEGKKRQSLTIPSTIAQGSPWSLAFAPKGEKVAGLCGEGEIYLWDLARGEGGSVMPKRLELHGMSLAFSPDGKTLAIVSPTGQKVRLLDAATLRKQGELKIPIGIFSSSGRPTLVFSPDSRLLATTYYDASDNSVGEEGILVCGVGTTKKIRRFSGKLGYDPRILFAPDGKTLVCHDSTSSEIRLWDVASGRRLQHQPGHDTSVHALAISPDGRTIASGDYQPGLRLWDAVAGKPLHAMKGDNDWTHTCLFSSDGKQIISAGVVGTFQVWDVATGKEQRRFEIDWPRRGLVDLHAVGISADGKRLSAVASGGQRSHPAQMLTWDIATGKQGRPQACRLEERSYGEPPMRWLSQAHATFAPEGDRLTVWLGDRVGIEEWSTGSLLATLPKGVGQPMVFSPDGRLVAAALLRPKKDPSDGDDRMGLSLIETASGDEIFRLDIGAFDYAAFTPDGRGIVVTDKKVLRVWDTATGARLHQMAWPESIVDGRGEATVCSLAVLPGGRAATGTSDGDILVWDLASSTWPVPKPRGNLGRKELDVLWSDLASDARKAYRTLHTLTIAQAAAFLGDRLEPVMVDGKHIEKLLANLDGDSFQTREAAAHDLTRMCYRAEPTLRRALEGKPSLEMRRRLQAILAEPQRPPAEALRTLRAIAVLERIGTAEARQILEKLAGGAAARETLEAKAALQRLNRRCSLASGRSSP